MMRSLCDELLLDLIGLLLNDLRLDQVHIHANPHPNE
jgi:hypothetical protein